MTVALPAGPEHVRIVAAAGEQAEEVDRTSSCRCTSRRRAACSSDAAASGSTRCSTTPRSTATSPAASAPVRASGCRCSSSDRAIGVISAYDKARRRDARFTDDDVRLAEIFATRAAVAVELSERVERDALRRVVAAQELERQRLARELHDETGQALTSILLGLKQLEGTGGAGGGRRAARAGGGDAAGRPPAGGRAAAEGARRLRPRAGARAADRRASASRPESRSTSRPARSTSACRSRSRRRIYRIVQEALTNVVKHAARNGSACSSTRVDGRIRAVIEDDGSGFDPAERATAASAWSACASGSSCSTARSRSSRAATQRHDRRRRGAAP